MEYVTFALVGSPRKSKSTSRATNTRRRLRMHICDYLRCIFACGRFAERGELLRLISPTELTGVVAIKLPWPLPRALIHFHIALIDLMDSAGVFSAVAHSIDGIPLPRWAAGGCALHVQSAELRLRPLPSSGCGVACVQRTGIELELRLDLNKALSVSETLGRGILWAVEFALAIMTPIIWDLSLRALCGMVSADGPIGHRLREDATGLYAIVRRRTGQDAAVSTHW